MSDTKKIEDALDTLLNVVMADRRKVKGQTSERFNVQPWSMPGKLPDRAHSAIAEIIDEPIAGAASWAVRMLGEELRERGADLHEVADRVSRRLRGAGPRRMAFLNGRWAGIPGWEA